jgi:regulator of sigma E protease
MIRTIIAGLVLFTVMVISHEFGHFIAAKLTGIAVTRFSVGLGPKLWGFRFRGTEYVLSLIPLGGYVKMRGMEPSDVKGEADEFFSKSVLVRTFVVLSGPLLNLIFAFLIYFFAVLSFGVDVTPGTSIESVQEYPAFEERVRMGDRIVRINDEPVENWYEIALMLDDKPDSLHYLIAREDSLFYLSMAYGTDGSFPFVPMVEPIVGIIEKGSPADKAGLKQGDRIIMVEDTSIRSFEDMRSIIQQSAEKELAIAWDRDGVRMQAIAVPLKRTVQENGEEKEIGMLGIVAQTEKLRFGLYGSLKEGFLRTGESIKLIVSVIVMLFRRQISPKTLGGPIAIFQLAGESARWGFEFYLGFMALLSINLFILNLIPFPPLDGAHILIFGIEKLTRKRPTEKQYALIQQIGFAILLIAIAFIFYNDIMRIRNR